MIHPRTLIQRYDDTFIRKLQKNSVTDKFNKNITVVYCLISCFTYHGNMMKYSRYLKYSKYFAYLHPQMRYISPLFDGDFRVELFDHKPVKRLNFNLPQFLAVLSSKFLANARCDLDSGERARARKLLARNERALVFLTWARVSQQPGSFQDDFQSAPLLTIALSGPRPAVL